jgi:hypothetical protein
MVPPLRALHVSDARFGRRGAYLRKIVRNEGCEPAAGVL